MRVVLALVLLTAMTVRGEDNCGRMERFATNVMTPPPVVELQVVWLACDGAFRRFEELVPTASRAIETYDGWIEVGHVYRAEVAGRKLEPHPSLPRHHGGGYGWTNEDGLLPDDEQRRTVVFAVVSQEIEYRGERNWLNLMELAILEVHE